VEFGSVDFLLGLLQTLKTRIWLINETWHLAVFFYMVGVFSLVFDNCTRVLIPIWDLFYCTTFLSLNRKKEWIK